jgi:glycosyltransferase involved in cell wall biosynthesis
MKILLITSKIGQTATGIVTKNIIEGLLQNGAEVHVISDGESNVFSDNVNLQTTRIKYKRIKSSSFFSELCLLLLKYPLNEIKFIKKATKKAIDLHSQFTYDIVMVLSSAAGFHLLRSGLAIKHKTKLPLYIHSTDPIPAPKEWYNTQSLRTALIASAKKVYKKADVISLSNEYMLEYQLRIMNIKNIPSLVIHNPSTNHVITQNIQNDEPKIFLYVGSIYHQRQPDELLKAFEIFSKDKKVELWFLGNNKKLNLEKHNFNKESMSKIRLLDFQKDPSKIIEQAHVLIDFDANFKNDVFISSKLITYLNTNIPILSLTPRNSPSDNLLNDNIDLGVVKMYYDEENMPESLQRVISLNNSMSQDILNNRNKLLTDFDKNNVGEKMLSFLKINLFEEERSIDRQ